MRAYSFRLATVLRVRRIEAALVQQQCAGALRALNEASDRYRALTTTYNANHLPAGTVETTTFIASRERSSRLSEMLADLASQTEMARSHLVDAQTAAVFAERRVAVLERLDHRYREEWLAELEHENRSILDDFATVRAAAASMEASRVH